MPHVLAIDKLVTITKGGWSLLWGKVVTNCYRNCLIIFYSFNLQKGFELRSLGPMATIPSAESLALPKVALTLKMTLRFSFFLLLQQINKFWKPIEATERVNHCQHVYFYSWETCPSFSCIVSDPETPTLTLTNTLTHTQLTLTHTLTRAHLH